ncbi:hypothetical protein [Treponema sp.]|nr:hypothetical protein [Treponema sp.]
MGASLRVGLSVATLSLRCFAMRFAHHYNPLRRKSTDSGLSP